MNCTFLIAAPPPLRLHNGQRHIFDYNLSTCSRLEIYGRAASLFTGCFSRSPLCLGELQFGFD
jgi:hypothetical protein